MRAANTCNGRITICVSSWHHIGCCMTWQALLKFSNCHAKKRLKKKAHDIGTKPGKNGHHVVFSSARKSAWFFPLESVQFYSKQDQQTDNEEQRQTDCP